METSKEKEKKPELPNCFSYSGDKKTILQYTGDDSHVLIPEDIITIGDVAFKNKKIKSVSLPKSLQCIGHYAFCNCKLLTSIEIPDNCTAIGDYAFKGCRNLTAIEITNVKRIGKGACDFTAICLKQK